MTPTPFHADDAVTIWHANARELPLPDESVDLVVTSPPYFGLRSYQDGGEHYTGQIGDEPTPAEFVDALIDCSREMVRVLKPSGSIWVNLGDKYAGAGRGNHDSGRLNNTPEMRASRLKSLDRRQHLGTETAPTKSLIGVPWRYAIRCVDDLRLILRAEVIWSKPNGLPESVTDRVRRSHETWFHFTRSPRYYSAVDEIREPHVYPLDIGRPRKGYANDPNAPARYGNTAGDATLGKLPGSVWEIPTQPLKVPDHLGIDHFAAFPMEWPRRIIRGWSPSGICVECGEGRRPSTRKVRTSKSGELVTGAAFSGETRTDTADGKRHTFRTDVTITGETCACPEATAPTRPAVVLDPFSGTGTTGLVAAVLGRRAHLVDLSEDYCRLAVWRVTDPAERARALQVDKPPPVPEGLDSLLDLLNADSPS